MKSPTQRRLAFRIAGMSRHSSRRLPPAFAWVKVLPDEPTEDSMMRIALLVAIVFGRLSVFALATSIQQPARFWPRFGHLSRFQRLFLATGARGSDERASGWLAAAFALSKRFP